jgi:hypothetical protein
VVTLFSFLSEGMLGKSNSNGCHKGGKGTRKRTSLVKDNFRSGFVYSEIFKEKIPEMIQFGANSKF